MVASGDRDQKRSTTCFVHQLLEKQRKRPAVNPSTLIEDRNHDNGTKTPGEETHSRLLTKRQLADMAMEVRELSKNLTSVRLRLKVKTVFVLVKAHDESLIGFTKELVDWLLSDDRDTPYIVFVYTNSKNGPSINHWLVMLKILWKQTVYLTPKVSFHENHPVKAA